MPQLRSQLLLVGVALVLLFSVGGAAAQDDSRKSPAETPASATVDTHGVVTLTDPSWQAVLDQLFGTPDHGLVDGTKAFEFRVKDVTLTAEQSAEFFAPSSASSENLAALIEAVQALKGQVRMDGTIDGQPFELKLAGRELKLDGLTLTSAEREALSVELLSVSGLHEAKIDAIVDGKATMIVIAGGKERIELVAHDRDRNDGSRGDTKAAERHDKIEVDHRADLDHKVEVEHPAVERPAIERPAVERPAVERPERVETHERVELPVRIEKPEIPRVDR